MKKIVKPRLIEEMQKEVDEVLDKSNQEEVDFMVSNLGKTLEKIEKKATERGIENGKIEVVKNLLKMGLTVEQVSAGTGISKEKVEELRKEMIM